MFFRRNRRTRAPRVTSKKLFRSYRPLLEQLESRVVPSLDFSGGFAGASSSLTLNGSAAITGSVLRLTQHDHNGQAGSAFSNIKQDVASFNTSFTFDYNEPHADGFTFCIQGGASTALGPTGGGLGYGPDEPGGSGGIANSVAVKFDLYDNLGEGDDSTGLYQDGASPTNVGSIDLHPSGVDLHSGHLFSAQMNYDGTTLQVIITDTNTGASDTQNYTVNIPSVVGGSTAFVGFTGADGDFTATQDILTWTYDEGPATPPAAPTVTATGGTGKVNLTWTASAGAATYNIYRSTTAGGEGSTPFKTGVNGTSFTDFDVVGGTTYFYQVAGVGIGGEGPRSTEVSATPNAGLDFSSGFAGASDALTTNGSAKFDNDPVLELTDGQNSEAGSAFSNVKETITSFNTAFSFRLTEAVADGFTFCIENAGTTALGPDGGGLGYGPDETGGPGGIPTSVAVKFDLYNNQGEGNDSTGLYENGAAPTNVGSVDLHSSGIDLHSEDVFNVAMTYDGTTLKVTLTDTNTGHSNTQNYTVDIPTIVGGSTAFVGFTGATGGLAATQDILNWTFSSKVSTTTLVSSSPNPSQLGQTVTFTATVAPVNSTASSPTGTVTFTEGATTLASSVTLNGSDQATFTTSSLAVGSHTITAAYSGDSTFGASTGSDSASPQVVSAASKSATSDVTSSVNPSVHGQTVTFSVTVSAVAPATGTPTGTVTFSDQSGSLGTGTLNGSGVATFSTSTLSTSKHTVTASYSGDSTFSGSNDSASATPLVQTVNQASTTTTVASATDPSVFGQMVTFTATIAPVPPGAGTPTGTVNFTEGTLTLASSVTLNGSDQATFATALLGPGTHTITAAYSGDTNFATSTGNDSASPQVVNQAATTTTVGSAPNPSVFGQPVTFTATVTPVSPGAGLPSGTVDFKEGTTDLTPGGVTLSGGVATFTASTLTVGTHTITAVYSGDTDFKTSTGDDSTSPQVVNKASTTTTLASTPNPSVSGQTVTFTATVAAVSPGTGTPTGTVNFTEGAATLASGVTLNGSDQATFTISSLAVGSHTITATYSGDTNFTTSTGSDSASPQVVNKASTTTTVGSTPNPSVSGQTVTFTATVAPVSPGEGTPTGTVNFTEGAATLATSVTLNGSDQATFTISSLAVGSHTITAVYSGDASFSTSTGSDSASPQVVNKASTTTMVGSAPNPSVSGQTVTFTATVAPVSPGEGTPTGTVSFTEGATTLATSVTLNGSDQATFTISSLAVGSHTITAAYSGDTSFTTSTGSDSASPQVVNKASTITTVGSTPNPSTTGQIVTFTATVAPVSPGAGTSTGTVNFTEGATTLATSVTLNGSDQATFKTSSLAVGSHTITAVYSGDASFTTSTGSDSASPQVVT